MNDLLQRALERVTQVPWLGVEPRGAIFLGEPGASSVPLPRCYRPWGPEKTIPSRRSASISRP